ncbi:MAG: CYTH domain-containing protein [Shinella sp.]|nr:CYTH domain-containing protein [Shinella sp.]
MAKEIERKFLVKSSSWKLSARTKSTLRQAYLASAPDRSVRIRIRDGERASLTIKIGRSAITRDEFEYDIPIEDAEELMSKAIGTVIEKTRYRVPYHGFTWEIDVFSGAYRGLVIAEVEMDSEADRPELPPWLGREVTGVSHYSNQSLATEPQKDRHVLSYTS